MQLMPNGDIALCEDTPDYVAGNIFEQEPMEIWNGHRYRKFRKYILENGIFPVCSRCSALYEIPHYLNALM
jgi:radical SAM protein with 4Fe4S-binding SPASM domain